MGRRREEHIENFNIKSRPLTAADEKAISAYISKRKKELGLDEERQERDA